MRWTRPPANHYDRILSLFVSEVFHYARVEQMPPCAGGTLRQNVKVAFLYLEVVALAFIPKPIPRWDVHFGEIDDAPKDSMAPHITFRPQPGGHR